MYIDYSLVQALYSITMRWSLDACVMAWLKAMYNFVYSMVVILCIGGRLELRLRGG